MNENRSTFKDEEKVSFLEQQIKKAREACNAPLKSVVEECVLLEIPAWKNQETEFIMTVLPDLTEQINTLEGIEKV